MQFVTLTAHVIYVFLITTFTCDKKDYQYISRSNLKLGKKLTL